MVWDLVASAVLGCVVQPVLESVVFLEHSPNCQMQPDVSL